MPRKVGSFANGGAWTTPAMGSDSGDQAVTIVKTFGLGQLAPPDRGALTPPEVATVCEVPSTSW